jgi:ankyrin repeat protein
VNAGVFPPKIVKRNTGLNAQLLDAVPDNDSNAVQKLLQQGADIEYQNEEGETALMIAVEHGHNVVETLLAAGANMNAIDANGWTALMIASLNGDQAVVANLIKHGADLGVTDEMVMPEHSRTQPLLTRVSAFRE